MKFDITISLMPPLTVAFVVTTQSTKQQAKAHRPEDEVEDVIKPRQLTADQRTIGTVEHDSDRHRTEHGPNRDNKLQYQHSILPALRPLISFNVAISPRGLMNH